MGANRVERLKNLKYIYIKFYTKQKITIYDTNIIEIKVTHKYCTSLFKIKLIFFNSPLSSHFPRNFLV